MKDLHKLRLRRRIKPRVPGGSKRLQVASPSFVFLLTGLDVSQRQTVTHICTHSSVRSVLEFSEEGTFVVRFVSSDALYRQHHGG